MGNLYKEIMSKLNHEIEKTNGETYEVMDLIGTSEQDGKIDGINKAIEIINNVFVDAILEFLEATEKENPKKRRDG
jgi:hypothetical protein